MYNVRMLNVFDIVSGKTVVNSDGVFYFKGPGINISSTGQIIGELHRIGGPAMKNNSVEFWCINGKLHRVDGPALIWDNGVTQWFLDDIEYSETEFYKKIKISPL